MTFSTPRAAVMAVFAAFGTCVGTFVGSVPQIIAHYGLDNASYGIGVTIMTVATIAAMGLSGTLARHISHRHLLLALPPTALFLLAILLTGTSAAVFVIAISLYGFAIGVLDVIMNAEGGQIELAMGKPIYTAFHGFASLSVAFFAIVASLLSTHYGTWASLIAAAAAIGICMVMVWRNIPQRRLEPAAVTAGPTRRLGSHFTLPLVLMGLATGLVVACEIAALFWSSKLLADMAPQLAAVSGLGAAFFGLCNALVRFPGDMLRQRFGDVPLMSGTILVAIVGFAGLASIENYAANVLFFALTGMGLALICPCLFAMAARETPANRAAGLSVAMLIAGAPRIIAPASFGIIAETFSIQLAFGLCAILLLTAFAVIRRLAKH